MSEFYDYFVSCGFKKARKNAVVRFLTPEIYIKLAPQNGSWNHVEELYIYIFATPFGLLMTEMFKDNDSLAWDYLPRKLRKDSDGCLGMVMAGVDLSMDGIENCTLKSTKYPITIGYFVDHLDMLIDDRSIFNDLYGGTLDKMLAYIEGMWVYLYFAKKLNFTIEKTLDDVERQVAIKKHRQAWSLKKAIDADIVNYFNNYYEQTMSKNN